MRLDRTAFVELSGSDSTGQLENIAFPFRTVQAAINAITSLNSPDVWLIILGNSADSNFGPAQLSHRINIRGFGSSSIITTVTITDNSYVGDLTDLVIEVDGDAIHMTNGGELNLRDVKIRNSGPVLITTSSDDVFVLISRSNILTDAVTLISHGNQSSSSRVLLIENDIRVVNSSTLSMFRPLVTTVSAAGMFTSARNNYVYDIGAEFCFWTLDSNFVIANSNQDILVIRTPGNLYVADLNDSSSVQILNINFPDVIGKPGLLNNDGFIVYSATDGQGSLWFEAGEAMGTRQLLTDHNVVPSDRYLFPMNDGLTVTLPPAAEIKGRLLQITPSQDVNLVNVLPSSGESISGQNQVTILDYRDSAVFQSNGTEWQLVSMSERLSNGNVFDLNIYLATTGDDANNGLTFDTPVLSIERAQEVMFEKGWNHSVVFNFRAGLYEVTPRFSFNFRTTARGSNSYSVVLRGDDPQALESGVVLGIAHIPPTGVTVIQSSLTTSYSGKFIRFTTGNLTGLYFQIGRATTSSVEILANISPFLTDEFEIVQNSTIFHIETNYIRGKGLVFQGIDFLIYNQGLSFLDSIAIFDGVTVQVESFNTNALFQTYNSTILTGTYLNVFSPSIPTRRLSLNLSDVTLLCTTSTYDLNGTYWTNVNHQVLSSNFRCVFLEDLISRSFVLSQSNCVIQSMIFDSAPQGFLLQNFSSLALGQSLIQNVGSTVWTAEDSTIKMAIVVINNSHSIFNIVMTNMFINNVVINSLTSLLESVLDSATIRGNSIIYNSNRGIKMISTDISLDTFSVSQINDIVGLNMDHTTLKVGNLSISNVFSSSVVVSVEGSSLIARSLTLNTSSGLSFDDSTVQIGDFMSTGHVDVIIDLKDSTVSIDTLSGNDDLRWLINHSSFSIDNLGHNGAVTDYFITAANRSEILVKAGFYHASGGDFISVEGRSRVLLNNLDITGVTRIINGDSDSVSMTNVTSTATGNGNFHYNLSGSHVVMNDCQLSGSTDIGAFNFVDCPVIQIDGTTINYTAPVIILLSNGILDLNGSVVNAGASDIIIDSHISNVMINNGSFVHNGTRAMTLDDSLCQISGSTIQSQIPITSDISVINLISATLVSLGTTGLISTGSSLKMSNSQISGGSTSGIEISNTDFNINGTAVNSAGIGIDITDVSRGILTNISGSNATYGVNLATGSNIKNGSGNTITGTINDVNVGNRGPQTWLQIATGLQAHCSDILLDPSQYVSISN